MTLCCPECQKVFERDDQVFLDDYRTLRHNYCFKDDVNFILDYGNFELIITKYPFLLQFK